MPDKVSARPYLGDIKMDIIELGSELETVAVQGSRKGYANDPYNLKASRSGKYGKNAKGTKREIATARAKETRRRNQKEATRLNTTVRALRENPGDRRRLERNAQQRARRAAAREAAGA